MSSTQTLPDDQSLLFWSHVRFFHVWRIFVSHSYRTISCISDGHLLVFCSVPLYTQSWTKMFCSKVPETVYRVKYIFFLGDPRRTSKTKHLNLRFEIQECSHITLLRHFFYCLASASAIKICKEKSLLWLSTAR